MKPPALDRKGRVQQRTPLDRARRRVRWIRVRIAVLGLLLLSGGALVGHRAFVLQVVQGDELRAMAEEQYLRDIRLAPKRGTIYDRHGAELAVSVEVDSVWANPRLMRQEGQDPAAAAARVATVIPIDVDRIVTRLQSDRYFVWVERRITPQQAAAVRRLDIPGIHLQREARRFYPNRQLAAHLLGFANIDGAGIEGIELAFEERLRGSIQAVPAIRDRRGAIVFSEQLLDDRAAQGDDLTLTIDKTIQRVAEREIEMAVRTFEAQSGSVVVMDPRTGELLAMANYPTYNPNDPGRAQVAHRRNRAVTDRFEPGSTLKPFTIAAAFAAGTIRADQLIDCGEGSMEVAEYTIHDSHPYAELTPAQILAYSSNIGTARVGHTLGRRGLYRALRRFGFGEPTGLPVPGETGGILRHYRRWYDMDHATIAFGQGMSVTTMQLALGMSAVANGGRLMEPMLIRRVTDSRGGIVEESLPRVRRQVIPRPVARLVADMMTAVTGPGGTGEQAAIDGYLVAGKTGTAQKADYVHGGYAEDRWLASFVGFVPAEDPRLVIAVVVDEPIIAHYGGVVAAPVFRRIGEAALRHLGVPRDDGGGRIAAHVQAMRDAEAAAAAASAATDATGAPVGPDGVAAPVAEVAPPPPAPVPGDGETVVPDLMGRSARAVLVALREAQLTPMLQGSGLVVSQYPPGGHITARGTQVRTVLERPSPEDVPDIEPIAGVHQADVVAEAR